jgi:hypothetical protein
MGLRDYFNFDGEAFSAVQDLTSSISQLFDGTNEFNGLGHEGVAYSSLGGTSTGHLRGDEKPTSSVSGQDFGLSTVFNESMTFLRWAGSLDQTSKELLNWNRIATAEIHIVHKVAQFVQYLQRLEEAGAGAGAGAGSLTRGVFGYSSALELAEKGYKCTPLEALQQEAIKRTIKMDICSEVEWYKLLHLSIPDVSNFVDVGSNKGYLSSLFLSLWGGGNLGVTPISIYETARSRKTWVASRNPGGYCRDGFNYGIPFTCGSAQRDPVTGSCKLDRSAEVEIASIEGSSYLVGAMNTMIGSAYAHPRVRSGDVWKYYHYGGSDQKGVAYFTKQSADKNAGFEGGHLSSSPSDTMEAVNMTDVDSFLKDHNKFRKSGRGLEVLKIDAEGHDNKVIVGASEAIVESVKFFSFEGGKGITLSKAMLEQFDSLSYSCYSTSRAGLFKWSGGCMLDKYMGNDKASDKGNVFCVNRKRAPMAALLYDALSFPLMNQMHKLTHGAKTVEDLHPQPTATSHATADPYNPKSYSDTQFAMSEFAKVFTNIKPWCNPWPLCVSKI